MSSRPRVIFLIALIAAGGLFLLWSAGGTHRRGVIRLYGNVDLREIELPFNVSDRISEILVEEGQRVHKGDVLARLDTSRLRARVAEASARKDAQARILERLVNGTRPEEIAQARANVEAARADARNARVQFDRLTTLQRTSGGRAISRQDLDNAEAALGVGLAKLSVAEKGLELALAGPRREEVAENEARLAAAGATLLLSQRDLEDAELVAPADTIVRNRLMEPGEIASPQRAALALSVVDPKWIRAYLSEPDLGRVRAGMGALITTDSFPDRPFEGWIGFISSEAEFTPKAVETEELRTSLVYEVRIFVKDPEDRLRLGMPATIDIAADGAAEEQP